MAEEIMRPVVYSFTGKKGKREDLLPGSLLLDSATVPIHGGQSLQATSYVKKLPKCCRCALSQLFRTESSLSFLDDLMARTPFGVIEARPVSPTLHFWTCSPLFSFAENPKGYQRGVREWNTFSMRLSRGDIISLLIDLPSFYFNPCLACTCLSFNDIEPVSWVSPCPSLTGVAGYMIRDAFSTPALID